MKNNICFLFIISLVACNTTPEPLIAGKDSCASCMMTVSDLKYGAEIISTKGRIYKFDDIGCMIEYIRAGNDKGEHNEKLLTVNYTGKNELIDVNQAHFVLSDIIHSPMNSRVAAFSSKGEAEKFLGSAEGRLMSWPELYENFR